MNWDSLDKDIKKALSGHNPDVDADAIWAAIEPAVDDLNRRKRRRRGLWLWWAGALVAVAAIGLYCFGQTDGWVADNGRAIEIPEKKEVSKVVAKPMVNGGNTDNGGKPSLRSAQKPWDAANKEPLGTKLIAPPSIRNGQASKSSKIGTLENKLIANEPFTNSAENPQLADVHHALAGENEQLAGADQLEVKPLEALANRPIGFLETSIAPPSLQGTTLPVVKAPPPLRRQFNFSTSLQGSISFVGRKLEAKNASEEDLLALREKTERILESYQIGLGFTLGHRSGFGLSSGLNYTQINERFELKTTVLTVDTINDVKYLLVNLYNDTIPIYGDVPLTTRTTLYKKYYNQLRMIDIPILAGYDIKLRNAAIGVQAGVFVNMRLRAKGQVLESAASTADLADNSILKANIGLSYYLGASAGYMFNENLEVYIAPFARHFPKSFTKEGYGLQQRYNLFGINMGARYRF